MNGTRVSWLITVNNGAYRFWSGSGDLVYQGNTYRGSGEVLDMGEPELAIGQRPPDFTFRLAISGDAALQTAVLEGLGPVPVRIVWISSVDHGLNWTAAPFAFSGILSRSTVRDGGWTAEIRRNDRNLLDRSAQQTHQDQQEQYPGDRGMEQMASLERGINVPWPP